jgi:hypothetical protein
VRAGFLFILIPFPRRSVILCHTSIVTIFVYPNKPFPDRYYSNPYHGLSLSNVSSPSYKVCYMTGISTPPTHEVHVISHRICSGWPRPSSASAHVYSGLLTHRQLLTRGPKRPPFPARDPKFVHTALSQPVPARTHSQTVIPVCPSSCTMCTC